MQRQRVIIYTYLTHPQKIFFDPHLVTDASQSGCRTCGKYEAHELQVAVGEYIGTEGGDGECSKDVVSMSWEPTDFSVPEDGEKRVWKVGIIHFSTAEEVSMNEDFAPNVQDITMLATLQAEKSSGHGKDIDDVTVCAATFLFFFSLQKSRRGEDFWS